MKIRSRLLRRFLARLAVAGLRLLFATLRIEIRLDEPGISPFGSTGARRFLYCVWHDQIALMLFAGRPRHVAGLVSRHQDGSFLADGLEIVGMKPIRGSSSRGGTRALGQLLEAARELHIAITPDGPRGPRRELKDGIIFLASHSGRPIVPAACASRRSWTLKGRWTDLILPRPFSKIVVLGGRPLHVPANLSRQQIAHHRSRLQRAMDDLQVEAERLAAGQEPTGEQQKAA